MEEVFFINKEGKRFYCENISSHIGLANLMIKQDEKLAERFKKSRKGNPVEFLLENEGCIAGSDGIDNKITYDSELISEGQKRWIQYYIEEGYGHYDLAMERKRLQKEILERGED